MRSLARRRRPTPSWLPLVVAAAWGLITSTCGGPPVPVLTMSGSLVGREGEVLRRQLDRFQQQHPSLTIALRSTPDAADQRHQLYVQWLAARSQEPDVLQLDVVWTAEFAAAGWIAALDGFRPQEVDYFAPAVAAHRWKDRLFALPWFVDVGMLYWRRDALTEAPATLDALAAAAAARAAEIPFGFVWQGARYEGLVTVFVEVLGAFGGRIFDEEGGVAVDDEAAVRALTFMRDAVGDRGLSPPAVLTWQEEQVRFAFQNGQALFMRNWPYAYALLADPEQSAVAGRFAVAPMPSAPQGRATATLGGAALAINAYSKHPDEAYALMTFLLAPEQMVERAAVAGQFPARPAVYESPELARVMPVPPSEAKRIIEGAVPRPVTPLYSQMSELLQVQLHEALSGQREPRAALHAAAGQMRALLSRYGLAAR